MESDFLKDIFDNRHAITYQHALNLFNKLFSDNFYNSYNLLESIDYGMSFKLIFLIEDYFFLFRSEKGFVEEFSLKKNNIEINLFDYEPNLINIEATSEKNIFFLANVLKRFLKENQ